MDETSISASDKRLSVVVPKGARRVIRRQESHFNHHMTLILCVAADGSHPERPTVILPLTSLPPLSKEVINSYNFTGSDNGWITINIWSEWIHDVFVPFVETQRNKIIKIRKAYDGQQLGRAILFLDSHSSRIDVAALRLLKDNGIIVATIPAHTSSILQPLDCGINNTLKERLRKTAFISGINTKRSLLEYRQSTLWSCLNGLHDALNPMLIRNAFSTCGLFPWDPSRVLEDPSKVRPVLEVPPAPERPSITQLISGRIVTPEIIENHIKVREEEVRGKREAANLRTAECEAKAAQKEADRE